MAFNDRLVTSLTEVFDSKFVEQNEFNYKKTQNFIDNTNEYKNHHKTNEKEAHNTTQIAHTDNYVGEVTLNNMLIYQMERIRNLVLGVDGNGIKEVTDSRVSNDGKTHGLLSERLYYDFGFLKGKIDETNSKFVEINFDSYKPDKTGTTPVNEKLQEALDRIGKAQAGTLVIKNGTYLINKRLAVHKNTTIKMEEHAVILRGSTEVLFDFGEYSEYYEGYDGASNIHMIGGTLDNNLEQIDKFPVKTANMINIRHSQNISFKNVTFKNNITYHVLDINGVSDLRIVDCTFEGHINLLPETAREKEAIQISEVMQGGVGGTGAWDGTPSKNVIITGCTFKPSNLAGGFDVAIGNHASIHDVFQENFVIKNNNFIECNIGVLPYKWKSVEISNNRFLNNNECIRVTSVRGNTNSSKNVKGIQTNKSQGGDIYTIKNNLFENYTNKGVSIYGQEYAGSIGYVGNIRINDNTFIRKDSDKGENIVLDLCRHVHIKGNNMSYGYRGMNIAASHNIFIDNNYMENFKTEGVYINKSKHTGYAKQTNHLNITNNTINGTGKNGLYIQNSRFVYVINNKTLNTNLQIENDIARGGLYINDCKNGRIEGNDNWGETDKFAILGTSLVNFIAFNNGGSGIITLNGDSAYIGYYNVSSKNNIFKRETRGEA